MTFIHIDPADQDPDVPAPEDRQPCQRPDCPGEKGWDVCYGMAGGGMGMYTFCNTCERVIDKVQDPENSEAGNEGEASVTE